MTDLPPPPPPPPPSYGMPADAGGADVGSALKYGWQKFTQNVGAFIVIAIVVVAVQIVFSIIASGVDSTIGRLLMQGIGFLVAAIVQLGVVRAALLVTEGRTPSVGEVFKTDKLGNYIVASILYGIAMTVGILFCFVGVIIPAVLFAFYPYFVLDKGDGAVDSLKSSFNLVKANAGTTILLLIVAFVVSMIGALCCGVGLLVSIPVSSVMVAYTYKKLTGQQVAA